jgi:hypothetical protein
VELILFQPGRPVYPQLWGDFIANLSVLDLIFNCGDAARPILNTQMTMPTCPGV